jgi:hypothetical protein
LLVHEWAEQAAENSGDEGYGLHGMLKNPALYQGTTLVGPQPVSNNWWVAHSSRFLA